MKISFLIPSKNRLELLKFAVNSIRAQPGLNYEIVIVDNCSQDDYRGYVATLADPRITFKRQPTSVSVTQNWQDSLALATGDYVLMLGDDDALAPNFTREIMHCLAEGTPDVIYVAAYHYCYPNVIPGQEAGYLASVLNSEFLQPGGESFYLSRAYAAELAISNLDFRHRFGLNAQHYVLKASFIAQFAAHGGLYQSPYPDTYSSVAIFLHAESILVVPRELVIIGISPKSFGAYYFSGRHDDGYVFLDNLDVTPEIRDSLQPVILPGDRNDTNWLIAAEAVRRAFPTLLGDRVNVERYRTLQMIAVLRSASLSVEPPVVLADLRNRLSPGELLSFKALEAAVNAVDSDMRGATFLAISKALEQYHPAKVAFIDIGHHETIADAFVYLRAQLGEDKEIEVDSTISLALSASDDCEIDKLRSENARLKDALALRTITASLTRNTQLRFSPPDTSEHEFALVAEFNKFAYHVTDRSGFRTYFSSWLGHEMFKWPTDLWSYQEIIAQTRPEVIIETGTYRGGSALFLANLCELLDHGEVISVDIDISLHDVRPKHPRVTYIDGSSIDDETIVKIERMVGGRRALVILDSDHRRDHVLAELRIYERFVPPGGYIIVEDTLVNGHPAYLDFGPGPWEAVEAFLQENRDFTVDASRERVYLTQNPGGYLYRHT